jgi:hypothetical protein
MMKHMAYKLMSMLYRDVRFTQQGYTIQMDMYETKLNFKMNLTRIETTESYLQKAEHALEK